VLPDRICIVELNPYGESAGGGFFKWKSEDDKKILKGEAPFEFRITTTPIPASSSFVCWSDLIKRALQHEQAEQDKEQEGKKEREKKKGGEKSDNKDSCIIG